MCIFKLMCITQNTISTFLLISSVSHHDIFSCANPNSNDGNGVGPVEGEVYSLSSAWSHKRSQPEVGVVPCTIGAVQ